jgi:hypothetical protein
MPDEGTIIFETDEKKKKADHYVRSMLALDKEIALYQDSKKDLKQTLKDEGVLSKDEIKLLDKAYAMLRAASKIDITDLNHAYEMVEKTLLKGPYTTDEMGFSKEGD